MGMITTTQHNGIAIVKLDRGVTNALNLELCNELGETLHKIQDDPDTHGVVLGSANDKFFSIGFDIPSLFPLPRADFETFYRTFNQVCLMLYTLPKPTVAAITGHAIAGGCVVALCCDYRFIAEGKKLMGLNEVKLGVPVPYLADSVLRTLVGVQSAREMMEMGEFYPPEKALHMGLVDRVLPLEQVLSESMERAGAIGSLPADALAGIKRNRVEGVEADVVARQEEKAQSFMDCWYSTEARERLREAMGKF
jgi:enoyl-CoA hydratase/carnithine racemase